MTLEVRHRQDVALALPELRQRVEHRVALERRHQSLPSAAVSGQPARIGSEQLARPLVPACSAAWVDGDLVRAADQPGTKGADVLPCLVVWPLVLPVVWALWPLHVDARPHRPERLHRLCKSSYR